MLQSLFRLVRFDPSNFIDVDIAVVSSVYN